MKSLEIKKIFFGINVSNQYNSKMNYNTLASMKIQYERDIFSKISSIYLDDILYLLDSKMKGKDKE